MVISLYKVAARYKSCLMSRFDKSVGHSMGSHSFSLNCFALKVVVVLKERERESLFSLSAKLRLEWSQHALQSSLSSWSSPSCSADAFGAETMTTTTSELFRNGGSLSHNYKRKTSRIGAEPKVVLSLRRCVALLRPLKCRSQPVICLGSTPKGKIPQPPLSLLFPSMFR